MKTVKRVDERIAGLWIVVSLLLIMTVPAGAITWGWPDTEHENVGAMVAYDSVNDVWFQVCSGTLIHPYTHQESDFGGLFKCLWDGSRNT